MSLKVDYFQQRIALEPINGDDENMLELIEMVKNILAKAVVNYVNKGERFKQRLHLNNGEENGYTLKIKPDKKGACVIQVALPDVLITKIDFWQLSSTYLNNSNDFDLIERTGDIKKIVHCRKGLYHKFRDNILMVPLNVAFSCFVEMAKNIIAEAAVHFAMTNVNIITNRRWFYKKNGGNFDLTLKKINFGVHVEQTYNIHWLNVISGRWTDTKYNDNIEIDFRHLIKLRSISEEILQKDNELIRKQINITPMFDEWYFKSTYQNVNNILYNAAHYYYLSKEQIINKIEMLFEQEYKYYDGPRETMLKVVIFGEEDSVIVTQIYRDKCSGRNNPAICTQCIDFTKLKLEAS